MICWPAIEGFSACQPSPPIDTIVIYHSFFFERLVCQVKKRRKKEEAKLQLSNDIVKARANKMKSLTSSKTSILLKCQFELIWR